MANKIIRINNTVRTANDVLAYANFAAFPATGAVNRLYIANDTGILYRWNGTSYVEIGGSTDAVLYSSQTLTNAEKEQAKENIYASSKLYLEVGPDGSGADYIVDGVSDQVEINAALAAVGAAGGGEVRLLDNLSGYTISDYISIPSNTVLVGNWTATEIIIPDTYNASLTAVSNQRPIITNTDHTNGNSFCGVKNIYIDANATGRLANNATWLTNNRGGIYFYNSTNCYTRRCYVFDSIAESIKCTNSSYCTASKNYVDGTRYIVGGAVFGVRVVNFGSGYTTATVSFTGGGGSGAAATANIAGGRIVSITVTNNGTGYTSLPTVTITGDGSGASAVALGLGGMAGMIASSTGTPGVTLTSYGNRFTDNTVLNTGGECIGGYNARGTIVKGNTLKKTNTDSATTIHFEYCEASVATGNALETTTYAGLSNLNSFNTVFSNNTVNGSGQYGAIIHGSSGSVTITGNVFKDCQYNGVFVKDNCQGFTISMNQFFDNSLQASGEHADILLMPAGDSHRRVSISGNIHDHPNSAVKSWLETITDSSTINGLTCAAIGCYRNTPDRIIDVYTNVSNQVFTGIVTSQGENNEIGRLDIGFYMRLRKRSTQTASALFTSYAGLDFVAPLSDGDIDIGARSNVNVYIDKNNTPAETGLFRIYGGGDTTIVFSVDDTGSVYSIVPTYADNAAALSGGLVAGNIYKTATGELRIVV